MDVMIRTFIWPEETKKIMLCEHISIDGEIESSFSEYEEELKIFCNACNIQHKITILVN